MSLARTAQVCAFCALAITGGLRGLGAVKHLDCCAHRLVDGGEATEQPRALVVVDAARAFHRPRQQLRPATNGGEWIEEVVAQLVK